MQKSAEGFLREVLYQMIHHQKQLFVLIYPIFARMSDQKGQSINSSQSLADGWTLKVLRDALELIGRQSTSEINICLFVDALDEQYGNHRELVLMLRSIAQLTDNPAFRVRLALAGRPENVFKTAFQGCPGFSIHEYITDDIRHYAEDRIQAETPRELSIEYEEALKNLVERIVQKAQGVFLWVRLVVGEIIEGICEGDTMEELTSLLSTIPTELRELYKRALCRSSRGSLEVLTRDRIEAYVMFQIASCALRPFSLYDFLAATHFLAAGRDTYPDLQRLSEEQMERRLNSRSAGFLEVSRQSYGSVQFIHQTCKEFMTSGDGKTVIREGLGDRRLESGSSLIFRYILKLLDKLTPEDLHRDHQRFEIRYFLYYANILEWNEEQCVADSLEPKLLHLPEQLQYQILKRIPKNFFGKDFRSISWGREPHTKFCVFYLLCKLPLSLKKSLATHKASMERQDCLVLFEALSMVYRVYRPRGLARVYRILREEGVFACLSEDDLRPIKAVVEVVAREEEQSSADPMALAI